MGFWGFEPPVASGRLVQGEVLGPFTEYVPRTPPIDPSSQTGTLSVDFHTYPRVLLMTQDCDLEQDARERLLEPSSIERRDDTPSRAKLPYLLLCPLFADLRDYIGTGGQVVKFAMKNQNERYHALIRDEADRPALPSSGSAAGAEDPPLVEPELPGELFVDFRRFISLPTAFVYEGVASGSVGRLACVPQIFQLDLSHRFFAYQSRIPAP